jgi:hypothetical protein
MDDIFDMPEDGLYDDEIIEEEMDEVEDDLESITEKMADLKIFSKSSLNEDLDALSLARKSKTMMGPNFDREPCIPRRKFLTEQIVYLDPEVIGSIKANSQSKKY